MQTERLMKWEKRGLEEESVTNLEKREKQTTLSSRDSTWPYKCALSIWKAEDYSYVIYHLNGFSGLPLSMLLASV